jgi:transposase InsO family protein
MPLLRHLDQNTGLAVRRPKPVRYEHDAPGDLVHVDIKKLGKIPDGGGHRKLGRTIGNRNNKKQGRGYAFVHHAVDDHSRLAYSEILDDEQGDTAAEFWHRAHSWFAAHGVRIERALTDNGACYRSRAWRHALDTTGVVHKRTRPYRPQTNGKVERFHRILLEEWAYVRDWTSDPQRRAAYDGFMHSYNHHRSHGALGWATPMATLNRLLGDNLPAEHT